MNPVKFAETLSNIIKLPQDLRKLNLLSKLSQQCRSYLYRRPVYGNIQLRIFSIRSGNLFWIEFLYLSIVDCKLNKKMFIVDLLHKWIKWSWWYAVIYETERAYCTSHLPQSSDVRLRLAWIFYLQASWRLQPTCLCSYILS